MSDKNFNSAYIGARGDVLGLIPKNAKRILDVGCSVGALGAKIKEQSGAEVIGIELMENMAREAEKKLDKVLVGDVEAIINSDALANEKFDVVICADVLEHLRDPWQVLSKIHELLNPDGQVVVSLPNIRHIDTLFNLVVKGYWPYRDRGIHDRTHLRFFTKRNIDELFVEAGFEIEVINTNYRIIERPHSINDFAKFFALPFLKNFLAFQYLVRAKVKKT